MRPPASDRPCGSWQLAQVPAGARARFRLAGLLAVVEGGAMAWADSRYRAAPGNPPEGCRWHSMQRSSPGAMNSPDR
jgi:hypothetical protein